MEIFLFISFILSLFCNIFLILFLFNFYKNTKLLLKRISIYNDLQDVDISILKSRLDDFDKRLQSLFVK